MFLANKCTRMLVLHARNSATLECARKVCSNFCRAKNNVKLVIDDVTLVWVTMMDACASRRNAIYHNMKYIFEENTNEFCVQKSMLVTFNLTLVEVNTRLIAQYPRAQNFPNSRNTCLFKYFYCFCCGLM